MIRIFTFGGLRIAHGSKDEPPAPSSSSKRDALLPYLAVEAPDRPVSRDTLLALLWPEFDERRARNALNQLLYVLRSDLGAEMVASGRREIALRRHLTWCDARELEAAVAAGDYRSALELYRGDFLAGFHLPGAHAYDEWVTGRRARYREEVAAAGRLRAESLERSGDLGEAARIVQRVLEVKPFDESSVRRLMRLRHRGGDVGQALTTYEAYAARLRDELDAEPSPETIALLETIRSGGVGGATADPVARPESSSPVAGTAAGERQGGRRRLRREPPSPLATAFSTRARPRPIALVGALLLMGAAIVAAAMSSRSAQADGEKVRVAILPFENVGSTGDEHFAAGLTDELIVRLAAVPELEIVSGAGRGSELPLPPPDSVGRAYDAAFVLLGTVRWLREGNATPEVRVVPRLVRTDDRTEAWSESYEARLEDIFDVQARIAREVTKQLGAALVGAVDLAEPPTRNPEAYLFLLRGWDLLRREWLGPNLRMAAQMFGEAVERDSALAEAWAGLSLASSELYMAWERTEAMRDRAVEAALEARSIAPGAPETLFAQAMIHYRLDRDYAPAVALLERAEALRPADSDVLLARAYLERRRGAWETALTYHRRALELEPRVARGRGGLVWTLINLRRYAEAEEAVDEALELFPDMRGLHGTAAWLQMIRGDVEEARRILEAADRSIGYRPEPNETWMTLELLSRRYDVVLELMKDEGPGAHLDRAITYYAKGSVEKARAYFDSAAVVLQNVVEGRPDHPWMRSRLALAYAGSGRYEEALRETERAVELLPVSRDAVEGPRLLERLALVLVLGGRHEEAIEVLGHLLEIPSEVSAPRLHIDPRYDALRGEPGFQRLLRRHGRS